MSTDAVTRFFERITEDSNLQTRVKTAITERGDAAAFEVVDIAAEE